MSTEDDIRELNRRLLPGIDPDTSVRVIANPLQQPGHDEILRVVKFPDPSTPGARHGDRRLILDIGTLEHLLEIAKHSLTKRVVLHHCGVRVEMRRAKNGHTYEIWKVTGGKALPEKSLADEMMAGTDGNKVKAF